MKMIKRSIRMMAVIFASSMLLTSCFSYTTVVNEGAQGHEEVTEWNHYLFWGLAPVGVSDAKKLSSGAENYTVNTKTTFLNGLIQGLTFGVYGPTKTTVTK
jgi:hypothetical protein